MKKVLIIGAGRSATSLIDYMLKQAGKYNWLVTVADMSEDLAAQKINGHPKGIATAFNVLNPEEREKMISDADIVVSMLPARFHIHVAKDCLRLGKNLATASYVSDEMKALDEEAIEKGLLFLCEMGLDPGIDHMSAMELINNVKSKGGTIQSFKSYAGGLIAPESDDNPWHYKFTWNPRNVVLAGQGIATYLYENRYRHVPYSRLFAESELVNVQGMGEYDSYPNRVSLKYRESYGLENIPTILRATLRFKGFCKAWNLLIQLGLTDDSYVMDYSEELTYKEWLRSYLPPRIEENGELDLRKQLATLFSLNYEDEALAQLEWLGLFEDKLIDVDDATPAQILQKLLEGQWGLGADDKDMIIMQHEIEYLNTENIKKKHISTLVQYGKNSEDTAMAYLVGLPLAIGVTQVLLGNINLKGVHIPILEEIYAPILRELEGLGVVFKNQELECSLSL